MTGESRTLEELLLSEVTVRDLLQCAQCSQKKCVCLFLCICECDDVNLFANLVQVSH